MNKALFGPAGNSESFSKLGYKHSKEIPKYLCDFGLTAYEYQCGRGVKIGEQAAKDFGVVAKEQNIALSLHAPYYISLSSVEEEKRINSVDYIMQSATAADAMGATRIIVHAGSCSKMSRGVATNLACETLALAKKSLVEAGLGHIIICPETMGKINQLGTLDEVMELCLVDDSFIPCIDFGHLNARTLGGVQGIADYEKILDTIENKLGQDRLKIFHSHFSKIEYTTGGEKKHLTFADTVYGPNFDPLAELIAKKGLTPTIICESAGTQAEDAQVMMNILDGFINN